MSSQSHAYLHGSLGPIYAKTALPIIFVMGVNGLLAVADALFLGHFAGAEALAAVTLMLPHYMLVIAVATLVSSGMSSILARHLSAGQTEDARGIYAGSHGLAVTLGLILILLFFLFGERVALGVARGSPQLAELGLINLRITVVTAPMVFVLSINSDGLRDEGRVMFMAAMSLCVSLSNMGAKYVPIGTLDMVVAGSAYGTALAQGLALVIILAFRMFGETALRPAALLWHSLGTG